MRSFFSILLRLSFCGLLLLVLSRYGDAQGFVHPGIAQSAGDLAYMKQMVLKGQEPWKSAYDRLKASVDTNFVAVPHAHIYRGPYARPNIGGDDLSKSANMAYNDALVWYITNDTKYAKKAIDIINTWSGVLWDFDYNDAKLLAAWTGHVWCNAAEILRYTSSGWAAADQERFSRMLKTVYYPLLRYYYPQANGNWDGAIIHSLLSIAIYTNNRDLFNNAIDHFLHGPVNGSLFKYIYPSGQCQESMRDQGHVQLGLGEFAGAAQVAYTQGVDLFSIGNNRLGLGYEYTARFIDGETPFCYGTISQRAKKFEDDYEYVYRHYAAQGVDLPFTRKAADAVRSRASRSILTAIRAPQKKRSENTNGILTGSNAIITGASAYRAEPFPAGAVTVLPGQSIQEALDAAANTGKWIVLKRGIHTLPATLKVPSGVTISGEGPETILFLNPSSGGREAMINATDDMHAVVIRDLVIEASVKTDPGTDPNSNRSYRGGYNRGGIVFRGPATGALKDIQLIDVTIRNGTYNGVQIIGASHVLIKRCDITENGATAIPGPGLVHNVQLTHCQNIRIEDSRLDTSPFGCGVDLEECGEATISGCEIARNGHAGILMDECNNVGITGNLIEGNDSSGILMEHLADGCKDIDIQSNTVQYNAGYGVEAHAPVHVIVAKNEYAGNGAGTSNVKREALNVKAAGRL